MQECLLQRAADVRSGDRWEYGINMDWVGKAVEAVSGQSLEVYFKEKILRRSA